MEPGKALPKIGRDDDWARAREWACRLGILAFLVVAFRGLNRCLGDVSPCCRAAGLTLYFAVPVIILGILHYIRTPHFGSGRTRLPKYAMAYRDYLVAQYRELMHPNDNRVPAFQVDERIEQIAKEKDRARLKWQDLFQLELWVQSRLPAEDLERKAWLLRRRYEIVAGEGTLMAYNQSTPVASSAVGSKATPSSLKADLAVVLQDLYWMYEIRTAWGRGRDEISRMIGWLLMVAALALATLAVARWECCELPGGPGLLLIYEAVMMGATGGLVSLWRRLQITPNADQRLDGILEFEHGSLTIMFQSFISGAIFAFVLLLIFASGLADGTLFPGFKPAEGQEAQSLLCMLATASANGTTVAKLLVWCFIAGFAERFVPDFLDRLTKSAESSASPTQTPKIKTPTPPSGPTTTPSPATTPSGPATTPSPN